MKKKNIIVSILMLGFFVLIPLATQAEEQNQKPLDGWSTSTVNKSPVNCFDFYHFQSVQVSIGTDKDVYKPGDPLIFSGDLINKNNYPVVDGNVFIRISEKNPNYNSEGQFIIDEIIALSDINLDANETKPVEMKTIIPKEIKKGEYRADYFFSVGKKYNLSGLPFTNEIIIGFDDFQIDSPNTGTVMFNKSKTTVNGQKYNHIGSWPNIEPNVKAEIVQPVVNSTKETKTVNVQYDLYFWDSLNEKDKISTKNETAELKPNQSYDLKYTVDSMKDSVYMLKITATAGDLKSIVNIRLISNQSHPRLNYPAITKFPLKEGDNFSLFSCFHSTSHLTTKGKVILTLLDKDNDEIDKMEYDGDITGAMMADKKDIVAEKDYDYLKLKAQLLNEKGQAIEEYEAVYDCQKINSASCKQAVSEQRAAAVSSNKLKVIAILVALVAILFAILIFIRKRKAVAMIFFLGAFLSLALLGGEKAEAIYGKSDTIQGPNFMGYGGTSSTSIIYSMEMTVGTQKVRVNDPVKFNFTPEIYFNAVGGSWDSPYGKWVTSFPDPNDIFLKYRVEMGSQYEIPNFMIFFPSYCESLSSCSLWGYETIYGITPMLNMVSSDTSIMECSGLNCLAKKVGQVTLTANISEASIEGMNFYRHIGDLGNVSWQNSTSSSSITYPEAGLTNVFVWPVEVVCDPGYYLENGVCIPGPFCLESVPANSRLCSPDGERGLQANKIRALVPSCPQRVTSQEEKCLYGCKDGYYYADGVCLPSPDCTPPYDINGNVINGTVLCPGDDLDISISTSGSLVSACSIPQGSNPKCEYICNGAQGYRLENGICVTDCPGNDPGNATLCPKDGLNVPKNAVKKVFDSCSQPEGSNPKCQYTCNTDYVLENGVCVANKCQGDQPPFNAERCSQIEDRTRSWQYISSCGTQSCTFTCPVGCNYNNDLNTCACPLPGGCGSAAVQPSCKSPSANTLCDANSMPSVVSLVNNKWTWKCTGKDDGGKTDCSTPKDCSWIEVNP